MDSQNLCLILLRSNAGVAEISGKNMKRKQASAGRRLDRNPLASLAIIVTTMKIRMHNY